MITLYIPRKLEGPTIIYTQSPNIIRSKKLDEYLLEARGFLYNEISKMVEEAVASRGESIIGEDFNDKEENI